MSRPLQRLLPSLRHPIITPSISSPPRPRKHPLLSHDRSFNSSPPSHRQPPHQSPTPHQSGLRPTAQLPREGGNDPRAVFSELNVLSSLPAPANAIETIYSDGFLLNNEVRIRGDGVLLVNNEVFRWRPVVDKPGGEKGAEIESRAKTRGLIELEEEVWGLLDVVYPKPDLLILGTGHRTLLLHPNSRKKLQNMGISLDVMDTHNAAAQFNLLATERPGGQVAAALMVAGFGK